MSAAVRYAVELVYLAAMLTVLVMFARAVLEIRRDALSGPLTNANTRTGTENRTQGESAVERLSGPLQP